MAKILIAEDERDIRELIEFTLTALASHQVFKAADGVEAVEIALRVMPDLIMMDVRMPRMTGYEACKILKQNDAAKNIPIVFLSAKGQETEIDTGLDVGAYDYILKPFAPYELANRVSEILKRFEKESKAATPAAPTPPPPPGTAEAVGAKPPASTGTPAATPPPSPGAAEAVGAKPPASTGAQPAAVPSTDAPGKPGTDTPATDSSANVQTKDANPPTRP
jgi:two-component system alkaline phosphatase synthesis response regulator PhoP